LLAAYYANEARWMAESNQEFASGASLAQASKRHPSVCGGNNAKIHASVPHETSGKQVCHPGSEQPRLPAVSADKPVEPTHSPFPSSGQSLALEDSKVRMNQPQPATADGHQESPLSTALKGNNHQRPGSAPCPSRPSPPPGPANGSGSNVNAHAFSCPQCDFDGQTARKLEVHIERVHGTMKFVCFYCSASFKTLKRKSEHMGVHVEEMASYQPGRRYCGTCHRWFTSDEALLSHERAHYPYNCPRCSFDSHSRKNMQEHEKKHQEKRVTCCHCGKRFVNEVGLAVHERSHMVAVRPRGRAATAQVDGRHAVGGSDVPVSSDAAVGTARNGGDTPAEREESPQPQPQKRQRY
jgi:hypothetical protein